MKKEELAKVIDRTWADAFFDIAKVVKRVVPSEEEVALLVAISMFATGVIFLHYHMPKYDKLHNYVCNMSRRLRHYNRGIVICLRFMIEFQPERKDILKE